MLSRCPRLIDLMPRHVPALPHVLLHLLFFFFLPVLRNLRNGNGVVERARGITCLMEVHAGRFPIVSCDLAVGTAWRDRWVDRRFLVLYPRND